jgi:hypothetical protein
VIVDEAVTHHVGYKWGQAKLAGPRHSFYIAIVVCFPVSLSWSLRQRFVSRCGAFTVSKDGQNGQGPPLDPERVSQQCIHEQQLRWLEEVPRVSNSQETSTREKHHRGPCKVSSSNPQDRLCVLTRRSMRKPGRRHSLENPNNMAKARVSAAGAVQKKQRAYQRRSKKARAATSSCKQPSPESPILPHGFFNQNSELPNDFGSVLLFKSHPHNRPRYLTDGKLETESECVPKTDPAGANDMERIQQRDGIERKVSCQTTSV